MPKYVGEVRLYTDGGSRGNPGAGAIGILITDADGNELERHAECIGHCTNNQAEYRALEKGLDLCAKHTRGNVTCFLDSELVVRQMNGAYRLKNNVLRQLFNKVKDRERPFQAVVFNHVKRTNPNIRQVDRLLNEAMEGHGKATAP